MSLKCCYREKTEANNRRVFFWTSLIIEGCYRAIEQKTDKAKTYLQLTIPKLLTERYNSSNYIVSITIKKSDNNKIHLQNYGLHLKWGYKPVDKLFGVVCPAL